MSLRVFFHAPLQMLRIPQAPQFATGHTSHSAHLGLVQQLLLVYKGALILMPNTVLNIMDTRVSLNNIDNCEKCWLF